MSDRTSFLLNESDLPRNWYNINADSKLPPTPVLRPDTLEPVTPDFLSVLFPMELILQEVSTERFIPIPEEVREIYKLYRPTPLLRARRLEKALGTTAHIYYKNEIVSPAGSHKPNTAIPQAFFNKAAGTKALDHRDRRRAVGIGAVTGLQLLWPGPRSLHGQGLLPAEAVPPRDDGNLRGQVFASPTDRTNYRPLGAGRTTRQPRFARDRHLGGGGGGGHLGRQEEIQPGLGAQPRADAPERHRRRGPEADGSGQ